MLDIEPPDIASGEITPEMIEAGAEAFGRYYGKPEYSRYDWLAIAEIVLLGALGARAKGPLTGA